MELVPSRKIPIKHYASAEEARSDQERLNEAGILNYLGWDGLVHRLDLEVPEEAAPEAIEILGIGEDAEDLPQTADGIRCPQCQGLDAQPLPPYALILGLLLGAVVVLFGCRGEMAYGSVAVIAGGAALFWLAPRIARWRCRLCGNKWGGAFSDLRR